MAVSPPRLKGPPLNALRAFEVAARLGGFAAAAEELCVTPGAVAQQVKALEAWAGAALFERHAQGVRLTPLGADVLNEFTAAFDRLAEATQALRRRAQPGQLRIAALPGVTTLWLAPRLGRLRAALPGVLIHVTALESPPNLRRDAFDLALFFEKRPLAPGVLALCPDEIFPVCAPSVADRLNHPADLAGEVLLQDLSWARDWAIWLAHALPGAEFNTRNATFSLYDLAVEEALGGAGVLIGHAPLIQAHLDAGTLVSPFGPRVLLDQDLSVITAPTQPEGVSYEAVLQALRAGQT